MKKTKWIFWLLCLCVGLTACGAVQGQQPPQTTEAPIPDQWLPSMKVEAYSPTGATVLLQQEQDLGSYILLTGNDYHLQQYTDGTWKELPLLDQEANWVEAAFVLTAIPREEIDWQWLYGTLPEGQYRIGKNVTLHGNGENLETVAVYAVFEIREPEVAEETEESVFRPEPMQAYTPLEEVPASYTHRQAADDHVVVMANGAGVENRDTWLSFVYRTQAGESGTVRVLHYDTAAETQEVYDVSFDGLHYTVRWYEDGEAFSLNFKHLVRMRGDPYDPFAADRYVLVMNRNVTWDDIEWGMVSGNANDAIAHKVVYQERSHHGHGVPIPENSRVSLSLRGKEILAAGDPGAEKLRDLFSQAKALEIKPDMYYKGLDLIFEGNDGSRVTLWLSVYGDHFLYDGTFYQYSTEAMFDAFGITGWPEEVVFAGGTE